MIKNLRPGLAERGKIKIGDKGKMITSQRGKQFQPPVKLDHFRITTTERDETDRLIEDPILTKKLSPADGGKIREIPIRLLYDDVELNFPTWLAAYDGHTLWCIGDGERAERLTVDKKQRAARSCPCEHNDPLYTGPQKCKINGRLNVIIDGAERIGGVWTFRTTSYNSVTSILGSLALIKAMTGGYLSGIPLRLVVGPKRAVTPEGQVQTVHVVSVEYPGPETELLALAEAIGVKRAQHRIVMADVEKEARKLLELKPIADSEKPTEIVEEFYPEEVDREILAGAAAVVVEADGTVIPVEPGPADPTVGQEEQGTAAPLMCAACYNRAFFGIVKVGDPVRLDTLLALCSECRKRADSALLKSPPKNLGKVDAGEGLEAYRVEVVAMGAEDLEAIKEKVGTKAAPAEDLGELGPGASVKCGKCGFEFLAGESKCPECATPAGKLF